METPLKAIGFSKIKVEKDVYDIIPNIIKNPTKQVEMVKDKNEKVIEYLKQIAEHTYVMVRASVTMTKGEPKLTLQQCDPYIESQTELRVQDIETECVDSDNTFFVACEHCDTGMQIIFIMENVIHYLEGLKDNKTISKVNIAGLASEGTIILPIEKDEEDEKLEKEEREKLKSILQRAKEGDEEAREILEKEEAEIDRQLKERLKEEDFLSVMSGYFICDEFADPVYDILGDITAVCIRVNDQTKEEMYVLTLDVNDMPLEILINKEDLVGMPSVGMRFMGTCWLQGQVIME